MNTNKDAFVLGSLISGLALLLSTLASGCASAPNPCPNGGELEKQWVGVDKPYEQRAADDKRCTQYGYTFGTKWAVVHQRCMFGLGYRIEDRCATEAK